jgi:cell wall-associated NlpC family hydrolase
MKQNTTEPNSGKKRPNVFIHYALGIMLVMTASAPQPVAAAAVSPITAPSSAILKEDVKDPVSALLPSPAFTLQEYALTLQLDQLEQQLEEAEEKVDAKIASIDAEFEKYATVDALIEKLYSYVGKSAYVFSGIGPSGWDCSGLTAWFYKQYKGEYLEHRASAQVENGTQTDSPVPGDVVAFTYKGSKSAYHVAIYVGGGMMIHAKNSREGTVLESVKGFAKKNSKVAYIRY